MSHKILAAMLVGAFLLVGPQIASVHAGDHGFNYFQYPTYSVDRLPHFSENPPVYYGYPMKRSYGLSPYPYSGNCTCGHKESAAPAPEAAAPQPARELIRPEKGAEDLNRLVSFNNGYRVIISTTLAGRRVKTLIRD